MKFDFKFKSLQFSPALIEYFESRFERLEKLELKPLDVHVTFSAEGHSKKVNIYINGLGKVLTVHASTESFYKSIDLACSKLMRQMQKEKSKVKHHKRTVRRISELHSRSYEEAAENDPDYWSQEEEKIAS